MASPRGLALLRRRALGLVFLAVLASLVWLTTAIYTKRFADEAVVLLQADRAGNQLTRGADVKARGLLVGRVAEVRSTASGAELELRLDRDRLSGLSADVTAQLLPKTLFGEKYVALLPGTATARLVDGAVISQDRTTTALETAKVVDDLLPLLQELRPAALSTTLSAVSSALRGRGDRVGENLELVQAYLASLNTRLPVVEADLRGLADLATTLDQAAPDLLSVVEDLSASSRSLVDQQDELSGFLDATVAVSGSLESFVRENEQRLVRLSVDSLPSLQAFARYAPEYPCLAQALTDFQPVVERSFGRGQPGLHITLEVNRNNGSFAPGEEPRNGDDAGPTCYGLSSRVVPFPFYRNGVDGYRDGQNVDPETGEVGPGEPSPPAAVAALATADPVRALVAWERAVAAPALGVPVDEVPDLVSLLFGPVARGAVVSYE